jgi:2-polyprenyl-3-methyl-5-hydroxy-6-metoxy-1,4-benzoquinol methylase
VEQPESYLWDHTLAEEKARLDAQAAIWDRYTRAYLEALRISPGWRCLEVGAGSGTMTRWLADRVSPGGKVVAADIDIRFLQWLKDPVVEVRRFDITSDQDEAGAYDLVYARMVLMHLPQPDTHLAKMAGLVRPGGWLLVQDVDFAYLETPASSQFTLPPSNRRFGMRIMREINALMSATGADKTVAQRHPRRLWELGFEDIGAESVNRLQRGNPHGPYKAAFERVKGYLVQYGGVSERDANRRLDQMGDPRIGFSSGPMMSAWGRKPRSPG